jgi:membrane protease YdiL (CAAX protease family)
LKGEETMKRLTEWIRGHPLVAFFTIAIVFMFALLFPALYLSSLDQPIMQVFVLYLARVAVYSPVLAGLMVTRWIHPQQSPTSAKKRWLSLGITWIVALAVFALELRRSVPEDELGWAPLIVLSIPVAFLPAFVVSSAFSRVTSIRDYLSTLIRPRGHLIWYLAALLTFPVVHLLGHGITQILGGEESIANIRIGPELLMTTLLTLTVVFFYSGGINEEAGWRGFAQRHLQARYSPLLANLILWLFLVVWHVPNDIVQYREGGYLLVRIGLYPFITILFGWVFNRTRGSILAPAIFHASMNAMNPLVEVLPMTTAGNVLLIGLALFAILYDRMWEKLPTDSPAIYPAVKPA